MIASASYHSDGSLELRTPYRQDFVESLKDGIPAYARVWDPDLKVWFISSGFQRMAIRIMERFYDDAIVEEPFTYRKPQPPPFTVIKNEPKSDPDRDLLHLKESAPIDVVRAVYRVLAKECHPDRPGGSHERMQQLNAALERLESQVRSEGAA